MEYQSVALAVVGVIGVAGLAAYQLSGNCKSARKGKVSETSDSQKGSNGKKQQQPQNQQPKNNNQQQKQQKQQQQQQQPKKQQEQQPQKQAAPASPVVAAAASPAPVAAPAAAAAEQKQSPKAPAPAAAKKAQKESAQNPELVALQEQLNQAVQDGDLAKVASIAAKMSAIKQKAAAASASTSSESAEINATPDVVEAQKKELEAILAAETEWTTVSNKKAEKATLKKAEEKEKREAAAAAAAAAKASKKDDEKKDEEKKEEKKEKKTIEVTIDPTKRSKLIGPEASVIKRITEMFPETRLDVPKKDAPKQDVVKITGDPVEIENVKRIVIDLTTRGFSKALDPEIADSHVNIPTDKLPLIFGRNGTTISAIQKETSTSITKQVKSESSKARTAGKEPQETLIIVGNKDGIEAAKRAIRQIISDGYSKLVHPDWITLKIDFPTEHRSKLIGAGGGRIKKLKDIYKCDFKFPESDDAFLNIIGPAGDAMQQAQAAIVELREQFLRPPQTRVVDGFDEEELDDSEDTW